MGTTNELTDATRAPDAQALPDSLPACLLPPCVARYTAALLVQAGIRAKALHTAAMAPLGLRPRHHGVLLVLRGEGAVSQQTLGRFLDVDAGTIVDLVDELEERELVERRRNPDDRRAYQIHLTEDGERLLDEAEAAAVAAETDLLQRLSPEEQATLHRLLMRALGMDDPH
jgi:MarR family transcriptional regulator, lower aerobic nicotinate degradation pathway regulator